MFTDYFKIAIREALRNKGYTLINVVGLAVGMSCFIMISLLVRDELSYDRFHINADRIYRLTHDAQIGEKLFLSAKSSPPLAQCLLNDLHGVEAAMRIRVVGDHSMRFEDRSFTEYRLYVADSVLFRIFTFSADEGVGHSQSPWRRQSCPWRSSHERTSRDRASCKSHCVAVRLPCDGTPAAGLRLSRGDSLVGVCPREVHGAVHVGVDGKLSDNEIRAGESGQCAAVPVRSSQGEKPCCVTIFA